MSSTATTAVATKPAADGIAPAEAEREAGAELAARACPSEQPAAAQKTPSAQAASGLVICAISGRIPPEVHSAPADLWHHKYPSADLVGLAARLIPAAAPWDGRSEGPRWRVTVSPGSVSIGSHDPAKAERTAERAAARTRGPHLGDSTKRGRVVGWSPRSRSRMIRVLAELDYAPLLMPGAVPGMVTLTAPGYCSRCQAQARDHPGEPVACTTWTKTLGSADAFKAAVKVLRKRWARAWGLPLIGIWKLEFQRRGAPHLHVFTVPPIGTAAVGKRPSVGAGLAFTAWLSVVWADIVAHPELAVRRAHELAGTGVDFREGLRATDPRRLAVYFSKHGTYEVKSYQDSPPAAWSTNGTGRIWGYWGLLPSRTVVEVSLEDAIATARLLRRWERSKGVVITRPVWRARRRDAATGAVIEWRRRRCRVRQARMPHTAGFLVVNDGRSTAEWVGRYLDWRHSSSHSADLDLPGSPFSKLRPRPIARLASVDARV